MKTSLVGYLRLVRFPLIFTAIADSWAFYVLSVGGGRVDWQMLVSLAVCSAGLICFGMAFNDLLDFRKDEQLDPRRPIPSGQISTAEAAIVVAMSLLLAAVAAYMNMPWMTLGAGVVAVLIAGYNGLLKRWPAVGIIFLGLIRFHHAALVDGAWGGAFIFQPLVLMNHVILISVAAYRLEEKDPPLTRLSGILLAVSWIAINAAAVLIAGWQEFGYITLPTIPWSELVLPAIAFCVFVMIGTVILFHHRIKTAHARAAWLMRIGLPWLIVYDATFLIDETHWPWAIAVGGLAVLFILSSWGIRALETRSRQ